MKTQVMSLYRAGVILLSIFVWPVVQAEQMPMMQRALACVSGGIGSGERDSLKSHEQSDSFWLVTAARKTGEYLSDVKVRVFDSKDGKEVVACQMNGPWLFLDLPLGQYEVEAQYLDPRTGKEQKIKKRTRIHMQDHHQMIIYFDV